MNGVWTLELQLAGVSLRNILTITGRRPRGYTDRTLAEDDIWYILWERGRAQRI